MTHIKIGSLLYGYRAAAWGSVPGNSAEITLYTNTIAETERAVVEIWGAAVNAAPCWPLNAVILDEVGAQL